MFINIADLVDHNDPEGRTYREINNAIKHSFEVGQLVERENGARLFVVKQTRDCDGTPLYCLCPNSEDIIQERPGFANHGWVNGCSEYGLVKV